MTNGMLPAEDCTAPDVGRQGQWASDAAKRMANTPKVVLAIKS